MAKQHVYPEFTLSLLHPRYWLLWAGIAVLYLIVQLPYPLLRHFGLWLGRCAMPLMKKRVAIARRNLQLCFPEMSEQERETLLLNNFASTGMGVLETGMAWFWPNWRVRKWFNVQGMEHMTEARQNGRGVLIIGMHFLTLELGARIFGIQNPGVGVYRPNDNKLMDWLQTWGRLRSNKYMLDRRDVKGMIKALKAGEIVWYAPDHDYGPRNSVFAPFFAVKQAATTNGTLILARMAQPALIPFVPYRHADSSGYTLLIQPMVTDLPTDDAIAAATRINQVIEQQILLVPEQYMWLHRRFKTRPAGEPSRY
ncbi:MAG: Kdo(2)-lipid IV(A) acyltransferase [Enterobacteriaceae bacterium]